MSEREKTETYNIWKYEEKIPGTTLTLRGHSRGSEKTCFYIPQLKLFLDAGVQSMYNPNHILITHCHADHSFALPMLLTCIKTIPIVCVPNEHLTLFKNYNTACQKLSCGITEETELKETAKFVGVKPNDIVQLSNNYFAKVLKMDHSVPAVGYAISEKRSKLKDEYKGISGKEIALLRKNNVAVSEEVIVNQFAFMCDTSIKAFEINKEVFNYPTIIVECTFTDEKTIELAKEAKHIHWNDLKPITLKYPLITFILIHFSMRYDKIELEDKPNNVIIWDN